MVRVHVRPFLLRPFAPLPDAYCPGRNRRLPGEPRIELSRRRSALVRARSCSPTGSRHSRCRSPRTWTTARGRSRRTLMRALFPGGSITGAPKVRAMQIIEELEPTARRFYTGGRRLDRARRAEPLHPRDPHGRLVAGRPHLPRRRRHRLRLRPGDGVRGNITQVGEPLSHLERHGEQSCLSRTASSS